MEDYTITITFDKEAAVWYAVNDDIPIALESDSVDVLMERVKLAAPELLELNGKNYEHAVLHFTMEREAVLWTVLLNPDIWQRQYETSKS